MPDIDVERRSLERRPGSRLENWWGEPMPAATNWPFGDLSRYGTRSPFELISRFRQEMDRAFAGSWAAPSGEAAWSPDVEVFERGGNLVIHADLPGVEKDDVRVQVTGNNLTIEGQRKWEREERQPQYHRSERSYGTFCRSIALPEGAQVDQASARFDNGVLEVSVPIPAGLRGREIPIQTAPVEPK